MKIAIFSDSHGNTMKMKDALFHNKDIDYVFHLGDYVRDALYLKTITDKPVKYVQGNCDSINAPLEIIEEIAGKRFLATHGHKYSIKFGLDRLFYAAKEKDVHIVLYGHSHMPFCEEIEGILFINPGSIGDKRWQPNESYAIVNIHGDHIQVQTQEI
ncbi:MAG: metallophosphoesterase family protein [Eubacteriales bacterium]